MRPKPVLRSFKPRTNRKSSRLMKLMLNSLMPPPSSCITGITRVTKDLARGVVLTFSDQKEQQLNPPNTVNPKELLSTTVRSSALRLSRVPLLGNILATHTSTVVRYYHIDRLSSTYEIETFIDSIPVVDRIGKEVVLIVDTGIDSKDTFYTDSNGLELQKRVLNYRPTWDLKVMEPSSGNYYPVNGMILI
jgi:hypothetical protein